MDPDDLRAFAHRRWASARERLNYWAERYRQEGSVPARRAAAVLYEHARRLGSPVFGDASRASDLAAHVRVRDRLDRAARALTGR